MSCSLSAVKICAKIAGRELFRDFSLSLAHKQKLALLAPNGRGKSTLLMILAGLLPAISGQIFIFDDEMKSLKDFEKHRSKIGFLFQDSNEQFVRASVLDDVGFGLLSFELCASKEQANIKALKMLESLGISHLKDKICFHLSGGEKKLVALAGVLITEPKIVFLDEPTAGLDESSSARLAEILGSIDASMLIASHDKDFVSKITSNIYKLE
ncbi:ABC transporter ATP-binding protein [Campylobacter sp.]|uniref:energy-coupling factor ABC transporter ATP-binding protein n=1 Tax=Campylobacter sp. TaxID=205 RepID=UPI002A66F35A|nr:ABC transporter ATP-binding protein [Campylobacter sp.]MDD7703566.1 ABC transporter ATP-binding protein [Campylobacteraceae bacterium]MDY2634814.1 ABC transporter ATP-binding protein [Campylobacter sp.]